MSPRAIDRSIEILETEIDLYSYFFYISCHFVTYNVSPHLNTCVSRTMQVYASHSIALNNSRLKNLARVSLNANCFMFTSGCLLLFTFSYTFMAQKFYFTILQWAQETLFMHCANMSYMYHCLLLSTEVSNIKKFCARSLLVKICLQVKMNLFFQWCHSY